MKSLKDAIDLQASLARSTVEKTVAEASRLTDASVKLAEQTLAPLTARVTLAVEKFAEAGLIRPATRRDGAVRCLLPRGQPDMQGPRCTARAFFRWPGAAHRPDTDLCVYALLSGRRLPIWFGLWTGGGGTGSRRARVDER